MSEPSTADLLGELSGSPPAPAEPPAFAGDHAGLLAELAGDPGGRLEQAKIEERRRRAAQSPGERQLEFFGRHMVPFGSTAANFLADREATHAARRVAAGQATQADYHAVARRDVERERQAAASVPEALGTAAAGLPAMAAELGLGGAVAAPLKGVAALGRAAPAAAVVAQTAATPSMYLPAAQANAERKGGEFYDPKNLAPAAAYGLAQTAVFGRLTGAAPAGRGFLGTVANRTATGLAEQNALDLASTGIDRVLGGGTGLDTGWGPLAQLAKGDEEGLKHFATTALTFAALAAMHHPPELPAPRRRLGRSDEPIPGRPDITGEDMKRLAGRFPDLTADEIHAAMTVDPARANEGFQRHAQLRDDLIAAGRMIGDRELQRNQQLASLYLWSATSGGYPNPAVTPEKVATAAAGAVDSLKDRGLTPSEAGAVLSDRAARFQRLLQEDPATAFDTAREMWRQEKDAKLKKLTETVWMAMSPPRELARGERSPPRLSEPAPPPGLRDNALLEDALAQPPEPAKPKPADELRPDQGAFDELFGENAAPPDPAAVAAERQRIDAALARQRAISPPPAPEPVPPEVPANANVGGNPSVPVPPQPSAPGGERSPPSRAAELLARQRAVQAGRGPTAVPPPVEPAGRTIDQMGEQFRAAAFDRMVQAGDAVSPLDAHLTRQLLRGVPVRAIVAQPETVALVKADPAYKGKGLPSRMLPVRRVNALMGRLGVLKEQVDRIVAESKSPAPEPGRSVVRAGEAEPLPAEGAVDARSAILARRANRRDEWLGLKETFNGNEQAADAFMAFNDLMESDPDRAGSQKTWRELHRKLKAAGVTIPEKMPERVRAAAESPKDVFHALTREWGRKAFGRVDRRRVRTAGGTNADAANLQQPRPEPPTPKHRVGELIHGEGIAHADVNPFALFRQTGPVSPRGAFTDFWKDRAEAVKRGVPEEFIGPVKLGKGKSVQGMDELADELERNHLLTVRPGEKATDALARVMEGADARLEELRRQEQAFKDRNTLTPEQAAEAGRAAFKEWANDIWQQVRRAGEAEGVPADQLRRDVVEAATRGEEQADRFVDEELGGRGDEEGGDAGFDFGANAEPQAERAARVERMSRGEATAEDIDNADDAEIFEADRLAASRELTEKNPAIAGKQGRLFDLPAEVKFKGNTGTTGELFGAEHNPAHRAEQMGEFLNGLAEQNRAAEGGERSPPDPAPLGRQLAKRVEQFREGKGGLYDRADRLADLDTALFDQLYEAGLLTRANGFTGNNEILRHLPQAIRDGESSPRVGLQRIDSIERRLGEYVTALRTLADKGVDVGGEFGRPRLTPDVLRRFADVYDHDGREAIRQAREAMGGERSPPDQPQPGQSTAAQFNPNAPGPGKPPLIDRATEWVRNVLTGARDTLTANDERAITIDRGNILPRFQPDTAAYKAIFAARRGMAKIPGLGRLMEPGRDGDGSTAAVTARVGAINMGEQIGLEMADALRDAPKVFGLDLTRGSDRSKVMMPLTDGTIDAYGDVIEREMMNPGSEKITQAQRDWIHDRWTPILRDAQKFMREEGLNEYVDGTGQPLTPKARAWFPRYAIGKEGFPAPSGAGQPPSGPKMPGAKAGFQRGRVYETMMDGLNGRKADGTQGDPVVYDPDPASVVGKFVADVYRVAADRRLAHDPDLGGRAMTMKERRWLKNRVAQAGPLFAPKVVRLPDGRAVVHGKVFDLETADKLEAAFNERTPGWLRKVGAFSDTVKAATLTADFSVPFVQGLPVLASNPVAWGKGVVGMMRSLVDPAFVSRYVDASRDAVSAFTQAGGSPHRIADQLRGLEQGSFLTRLPVVGKAYEAFGRSQAAFQTVAKVELWKAWQSVLKPNELAAAAEAIENLTGAARMEEAGLSPSRAAAERLLALAPMYYRSAPALVATAAQRGTPARLVRNALGRMAAGLVGTSVAGMIAAGLSWDEIQERLNPARGKFLKVPISLGDGSKVEFGVSSIFLSLVRLLGDTAEFAASDQPITSGSDFNPLVRWARGHAGTIPRLGADIATGKDYLGERMGVGELVGRNTLPVAAQNAAFGNATPRQLSADAAISFLGFGSFPANPHDETLQAIRAEAKKTFGKNYSDLSLVEQAKVTRAVRAAGGIPKGEPSARVMELAQAAELERQRRLTGLLSSDSRKRLADWGVKVPGYEGSLRLGGVPVPLDAARKKEYEKLLAEEYERTIQRAPAGRVAALPQDRRDAVLRAAFTDAKERARARLLRAERAAR